MRTRVGWPWLFAIVLAACEPSEPAQIAEVCQSFCDCFAPFGSSNASCRAGCEADVAMASDACLECTRQDACHLVLDCLSVCLGGNP